MYASFTDRYPVEELYSEPKYDTKCPTCNVKSKRINEFVETNDGIIRYKCPKNHEWHYYLFNDSKVIGRDNDEEWESLLAFNYQGQ